MASTQTQPAKAAHVNLMTDTTIQNLPPDGLRSIMRSMLGTHPNLTNQFLSGAKDYLSKTRPSPNAQLFSNEMPTTSPVVSSFEVVQKRIRSMLGCGLAWECLSLLRDVLNQSSDLRIDPGILDADQLSHSQVSLDGDIVQALTAVEKKRSTNQGTRPLTEEESQLLRDLFTALTKSQRTAETQGVDFLYNRGFAALSNLLGVKSESRVFKKLNGSSVDQKSLETFHLGSLQVPRIFCGLWQLSSPSWGVASQPKIFDQFLKYVDVGFTAFDMADHYGDAEIIFGQFRSSYEDPESIVCATKYCVFDHITVTPEVIRAAVTERISRLQSNKVDVLQFHWQFYDDPHYIEALQLLQDDERVTVLGLCNFDTEHMAEIIKSGIKIASNQVQFSLIDSRPTFKMAAVCESENVKLLTYGTMCGGFLANKWLGLEEPELFLSTVTPSQRKYFEMIKVWGGWSLFQELLHVLATIGAKHSVTISNVATRWVLDFPYVGAVIVGVRMGVSERANENMASYGWKLDEEDHAAIEKILVKSKQEEIFRDMGDCGAEYR